MAPVVHSTSAMPKSLARSSAAIFSVAVMVSCDSTPDQPRSTPSPPTVTVAHPTIKQITDWDQYTGRLAAIESVDVRSRVDGYVESVHFPEGTIVSAGTLLYVVDPRPYEAVVAQSEAQLRRADVQLQLARNELDRAQRLFKARAISEEEFDARTQSERQAVAALEAARAALQGAQLDLEFTRITAPITGLVGSRLVTRGNLIRGGSSDSTLLTTLVSVDPIHFYFTADERAVLRYFRLFQQGSRPSSRDYPTPVRLQLAPTPVRLQLADERDYPHRGRMDFVDNRIDGATGTLRARAVFANPTAILTPGMFATIEIRGEGPYDAMLLPDEAIVNDQAEQFVYIVDDQQVVHRRTIQVGRAIGGDRIIRSGISRDDRVIIRGLQSARPGSAVTPELVDLAAQTH